MASSGWRCDGQAFRVHSSPGAARTCTYPTGSAVELPQAAQIAELVSMGRVKRRDTGEVVKLEGMPHDVGRFAFLRPFQFVVPIEPTGEPDVMPCRTCTAPTPDARVG